MRRRPDSTRDRRTRSPRRAFTLLLAAAALALPACPSHTGITEGHGAASISDRLDGPEARAFAIQRADHLLIGPNARGALGDLCLENADVILIISTPDHPIGFGASGGNLIDAATTAHRVDALSQLLTWFDAAWPRQAVYTDLSIVDPGGLRTPAIIEASGHDSDNNALLVRTRYTLPPTGATLTVTTEVENTSAAPVDAYELGDAVQWGSARAFAPGLGFALKNQRPDVPWLAGESDGVSYGWVSEAPQVSSLNGSAWSDVVVKTVDLPPGAKASYTRHLIVGDGTIASVLPPIYATLGTPTAPLDALVREAVTHYPVPGASVDILTATDPPAPFARAASTPDGHVRLDLPPGRYLARANAPGRSPGPDAPFTLASGATASVTIELSQAGELVATIAERGVAIPGKLIVTGRDGTPDPTFGPDHVAAGSLGRINTPDGHLRAPIPPGLYRAHAARGPEYSIDFKDFEIKGGATTTLDLAIDRVVDTRGWLAGDFHQHAVPSPDSMVPLPDRVVTNLAEGVEILVATDHNHVTDYAPTIDALGVRPYITSIVGDEVTTSSLGHFNVFPLLLQPDKPSGGALAPENLAPKDLFAAIYALEPADKILQVNHPRSGRSGYFDAMTMKRGQLDTASDAIAWDFDAIEVFNGKRIEDALPAMDDWFAMLNNGGLFVATGNSDTHLVTGGEPGYARNLVYFGHDDPSKVTPEALVKAIRARRLVATNAPFVEMTLDGTPIGGFVPPGKKGARGTLAIRVQAAPWVELARVELIQAGVVLQTWTVDPANTDVLRFEQSLPVPTDAPTWYVVRVFGDKPLWPVLPDADSKAFAFTNPIWVGALTPQPPLP